MPGPERSEALLNEISELSAIVLRIARRVHEPDEETMTTTQRLALIEIALAGPMRLRNLARRMETTPATATRAVDALEELGFVRRTPEPDDKRGVLVAATAILVSLLATVYPSWSAARILPAEALRYE